MSKLNSQQKFIFPAKTLYNLKLLEKYEVFFSFLLMYWLRTLYSATGRLSVSLKALLLTLIYKNLKTLLHLSI